MPITRHTLIYATASLVCLFPAAQARAESPIQVSGSVGLVSDYRYRGISLSNGKPAIQGGVNFEHESGFYAGNWASSIAETEGGAQIELDWLAGYATTIASKLNLRASVAYYSYPSDGSVNYIEGTATGSYAIGEVTPKIGVSYAPRQQNLRNEFGQKQDNFYAFTGVDVELPGTPITLNAQLGYESGFFDLAATGGKWDWQVGGTANVKGIDVGLAYIDSNARHTGTGRNLTGGTLIASALLSW